MPKAQLSTAMIRDPRADAQTYCEGMLAQIYNTVCAWLPNFSWSIAFALYTDGKNRSILFVSVYSIKKHHKHINRGVIGRLISFLLVCMIVFYCLQIIP